MVYLIWPPEECHYDMQYCGTTAHFVNSLLIIIQIQWKSFFCNYSPGYHIAIRFCKCQNHKHSCCIIWTIFWLSLNSLAPGKFEWNFRYLILQIISLLNGWGISCELALRWMPLDLTDYKSTLVQVMTWCHQATSHYLSQCYPRSKSPNGITRPQWVN